MPYPASCAALDDSVALVLPLSSFHRLLEREPGVSRAVIAALSTRLIGADPYIGYLASLRYPLSGEFAVVRGRGGPGVEHALLDERRAWERRLGEAGWNCIGFPKAYGGRDATLAQQVIFYEEYARAGAPGRLGHIGEGLLGPRLLHFGSDAQKQRFLPAIVRGGEIWCQGYSEPNDSGGWETSSRGSQVP